MTRLYFDHNATTFVSQPVIDALMHARKLASLWVFVRKTSFSIAAELRAVTRRFGRRLMQAANIYSFPVWIIQRR